MEFSSFDLQQFTVNFACNRTIQSYFIATCCSTNREDNLVFYHSICSIQNLRSMKRGARKRLGTNQCWRKNTSKTCTFLITLCCQIKRSQIEIVLLHIFWCMNSHRIFCSISFIFSHLVFLYFGLCLLYNLRSIYLCYLLLFALCARVFECLWVWR